MFNSLKDVFMVNHFFKVRQFGPARDYGGTAFTSPAKVKPATTIGTRREKWQYIRQLCFKAEKNDN
jgi:hypothetical protein